MPNNEIEITEDTEEESDMVDLGLSVKWAKCNLGASTPWSPGDIYTWGDTLPISVKNLTLFIRCIIVGRITNGAMALILENGMEY